MEFSNLDVLWVYLSTSPLAGLSLTLVAYLFAYGIYIKTGLHPLANTVLLSVLLIISILLLTETSYQSYFAGAQFIHFLLGPATVALAVPLYKQLPEFKQYFMAILISISLGIFAGGSTIILVAKLLGMDLVTQMSLVVRSVTAPVAMGIAEKIGGIASLSVIFVLLTGITGAMFAGHILRFLGIKSDLVIAVSMGNTSHGIGTARAFTISERKGAFAALAMAMAVILNALLIPLIVALWG